MFIWIVGIVLGLVIIFFILVATGSSVQLGDVKTKSNKQGGFYHPLEDETIEIINSSHETDLTKAVNSTVLIIQALGHGSGFVVETPKGTMIITNQHVIADNDYVQVEYENKTKEYGKIVRSDEKRDVALISIPNKKKVPGSVICTEIPIVGTDVFAIGTPLDKSYRNSVSKGTISYPLRNIEGLNYIQTDARINLGNSGGPLVNSSGHVIGITVSGLADGDGMTNLGVNHFIPISEAMETLKMKI